jgi:hypothetical protein
LPQVFQRLLGETSWAEIAAAYPPAEA